MVYGRKALVVPTFCEVAIVEKGMTVVPMSLCAILLDEPRLSESNKELRVNLLNLVLKE